MGWSGRWWQAEREAAAPFGADMFGRHVHSTGVKIVLMLSATLFARYGAKQRGACGRRRRALG